MPVTPEQLHSLTMYCTGFAEKMLLKAGAFYPFGAAINREGVLEAQGAFDGNEHPRPEELYALLVRTFGALAKDGKIIGAAIAADVNIPAQFESPFRDAVRVTLQAEGYSRYLYFPYEPAKKGLLRKTPPRLLEPFAVEVPPEVFDS